MLKDLGWMWRLSLELSPTIHDTGWILLGAMQKDAN